MQDTLSPDESVELARLWRRRQMLSSDEMGRMYRIVGDALRPCSPPELRALGEGRQELVAQFMYVKVLRLDADPEEGDERPVAPPAPADAVRDSAPSTAFALCAYFRRFLIDCTRASSFRRKLSLGDEVSETQLEAQLGSQVGPEEGLAEFGLSAQGVHAQARRFIQSLPEPERLLLCEGFGKEAAGGLAGIAARHAIASYHYRAGRLGLVHRREALPSDYAKTTLGRWIEETLGIAIRPDHSQAILQVFQILGVEASYA